MSGHTSNFTGQMIIFAIVYVAIKCHLIFNDQDIIWGAANYLNEYKNKNVD